MPFSYPKKIKLLAHWVMLAVCCYVLSGFGFPKSNTTSIHSYIEQYKGVAVLEMKRTGIPASITLGQAILESTYGNSRLAKTANNHFGFKCKKEWVGLYVRHHDDKAEECFRKYAHPYESFIDHSFLLSNSQRYQDLFTLKPTDYRAWANGLQTAHYASSKKYAQSLINLIDYYGLHFYDTAKTVRFPIHPDYVTHVEKYTQLYKAIMYAKNNTETETALSDASIDKVNQQMTLETASIYTVTPGETLYGISRKFNVPVDVIKIANKLKSDKLQAGQQLKIIQ